MTNDKIAQKKRYDQLSPNTKKLKNQKKNANRRRRKANKISKSNVKEDVVSLRDLSSHSGALSSANGFIESNPGNEQEK